ncbi:hypothetical protein Hte_001854 [Hypoxylon texense]
MHSHIRLVVAAATWVSLATTHVVLENPKPFRFVEYGPTNPIDPTGSNFPCKIPKMPGVSKITETGLMAELLLDSDPTVMVIGEEQTASFSGRAVHGGGSCQFSLSGPVTGEWGSYNLTDARWKVIHSIEGGCPARNQPGNLEGPNQDKYSFRIPEGFKPGNYIFSWTWVPRIGGLPEYYQNCAPIRAVLPQSKRSIGRRAMLSKRAEFPELFMADMGEASQGCTTEEAHSKQLAIAFPDPGASVERPEGSQNLFQQQCDGNPRARKRQGQGQEPEPIDAPQASQTATIDFSSTVSSTMSSLSTVSVSTASTLSTAAPLSSPDLTPTTAPNPDPTQTSSPGTCTEGHLTCLDDGTQFATCTGGQLTPPQPIAPGFKCKPGSGAGLDISPA